MGDGVKGVGRGDARRERWREHRQARRAEFIEATICAIQAHVPNVGMDEVAAEAGVTKPVIYRHFTDKADLYLAVSQRATEMLLERVIPALGQDGSPNERIRRVIDAYLGTIEEYPDLYRFTIRRTFADRQVDQDPATATEVLIANSLAILLGDYMRALGLDSGAAEPLSYALVGAVENAGEWWLERRSMSRESLTEYLAKVIWYAIDGFTKAGGVTLDPDLPLNFGPALRLVADPENRSAK